jgi:hypothetical protein
MGARIQRFDDWVIAFFVRDGQPRRRAWILFPFFSPLVLGSMMDDYNASKLKWFILIGLIGTPMWGWGTYNAFIGNIPSGEAGFTIDFWLGLCLFLMFLYNTIVCPLAYIGRRNKEKIPQISWARPFDYDRIKSGGIYAAGAIGVISLFELIFGK